MFNEAAKKSKSTNKLSDEAKSALEAKADELLQAATRRYETTYRQQNASKAKWFDEVSRAGTFADRLSVVQLRAQLSPMFALAHVQRLIESLPKKGHREAHNTLNMLKNLFLKEYLPKDAKLISFAMRPLEECEKLLSDKLQGAKAKEMEEKLIQWKYEDSLKRCYTEFLTSLEKSAGNVIDGIAKVACATMFDLLVARPEQEAFLLSALVNKLGHPSKQIAAEVAFLLKKLCQIHGNMRAVVVAETQKLIFRKNISPRAQYYAVHFLNHVFFRAGESDLAQTMIKIYLNLFKIVIAKCEHDHPLVPLVITGINRAVPYARASLWGKDGMLTSEVDGLYVLVHNSKFSIALNVLKLLFNIHNSSEGLPDRFYSSFYRRLLNVGSTSLNMQFFAFFSRVVKNDGVTVRVRAFLKRLLQIALASPTPEFTAAALLVVGKIAQERPNLFILTKPNENNHLNTNGIEAEKNEAVKSNTSTSFISDLDEEEERYYDVKTSDDKSLRPKKLNFGAPKQKPKLKNAKAGLTNGGDTKCVEFGGIGRSRSYCYDPKARNPLFANADLAVDVELLVLADHYHPSVQIFAKKLIAGEPIKYEGDPLENFAQLSFLERFALKNPKAKKEMDKTKKDEDDSDFDPDEEPMDDFVNSISDESEKEDENEDDVDDEEIEEDEDEIEDDDADEDDEEEDMDWSNDDEED